MDKVQLEDLYSKYSDAFKNAKWNELMGVSHQLGDLLGENYKTNVMDIRDVAQKYLGSLIGSGRFLFTTSRDAEFVAFESGLELVENLMEREVNSLDSTLLPIIKAAYEIQLFLIKPQADNLNKASAALRVIGRPDLAIELASIQISKSRLNYYSRNIRAAAYSDLGNFSAAIEDAQIALKYSPKDNAHYLHISLARALVGRFKVTGDLEDCEMAFFHAEQAFNEKPSTFSANVFLKVIHALGSAGLEDLISSLESVRKNPTNSLDLNALEIAKEVIRKTRSASSNLNQETDLTMVIDPWFDDFSQIDEDLDTEHDPDANDSLSEYYEDYFEEFTESLRDPQNPHLEP